MIFPQIFEIPKKSSQPPFVMQINCGEMYKRQFGSTYEHTDILENLIKEGYVMENDKMLYLKELIAEADAEEARLSNADVDAALADEYAKLKADFLAKRDEKIAEIRLAKKVYADRYAVEEKLYAEELSKAEPVADEEPVAEEIVEGE